MVSSRPRPHTHGLDPMAFFDLVDPTDNGVESLVPRDSFPFPLPPLSHPLQGVLQPVGMIKVFDARRALWTHFPLV